MEYSEVRKNLAALLAVADRYGDVFQKLIHYLKGSQYTDAGLRYGHECPDLSALPTAQQMRSLAEETCSAIARKKELQAKLKEFGAEPKD